MATPISFPQENYTLLASRGMENCQNLPIHKALDADNNPIIISCWELSAKELEAVKKSGKIYIVAFGHIHPPLSILGTSPFKEI